MIRFEALCINVDPENEYAEDNCNDCRHIKVDERLAQRQTVNIIAKYDTSLPEALREEVLKDSDESPAGDCCKYADPRSQCRWPPCW
jgi:hypothetical protein